MWCAYRAYKINPESTIIGIALLAVLFNPIVKMTFEKTTWEIIDFECDDFIIETISEWETEQKYFPELFINLTNEGKMNILPRGSMKIC